MSVVGPKLQPTLFERSRPGRGNGKIPHPPKDALDRLPADALRDTPPALPELNEPEVVRHYVNLSQLNFAVDTGFYPLGSCTMKFNPKLNEWAARLPGFAGLHPMAPPHFDVVESVQAGKQFGVDHGLDEAIALGPSEAGVRGCHLGEQPSPRVEEPQDLVGHRMRQDLVNQADPLERAQGLVVQADPAGVVDEAVSLVGHQRADTLQAKDVGQGETHRARPDDDDIHVFSHVSAPAGSPDGAG